MKLAGEEFDIKPPSYHVSNIIRKFKLEHAKRMSQQRDSANEIMRRMEEQTKKFDAATRRRKKDKSDTENIDALVQVFDEIHERVWKINDLNDKDMLRLVQLIVLDAKDKAWRRKHDSFPPDEVLETGIAYEKLYYDCDLAELQVVLDVYDQMNRPEIPRKNFQRLGTLV